ncbi:PaaX family transcriptional regulator C-terminal domain-containing protein [Ornithinimicrobium sp. LYQ92]|uniref:PaaX family transcriptional regulator n=1 Tax=Serinicoccus sp. LYQ92 TaxID=3378798 RepID=UPI00385516C2
MHARSAVVDLYGDHLRHRGWWAPVSAVVALAAEVDVQPAATRTAISRLCAQGWLSARVAHGLRGYAATPRAQDRWQGAHERVYAERPAPWDGRWHVVHVSTGGERRRRDQVARTLEFLGYGRLGGGGWVSPRPNPELAPSLEGLAVGWVAVHGDLEPPQDAARIAARVWDLDGLGADFADFSARLPSVAGAGRLAPGPAYSTRTRLVHEWRRFLFRDPALPPDVLPTSWPGQQARARFLEVAATLSPAAGRHVDHALEVAGTERA